MRFAARGVFVLAFALVAGAAQAVSYSNRYRSPRNPERRVRTSTRLIVLHTTEAPARSSLNKVSDRGECHFCVTEDGTVYRIVDRDREAFHAGRSMWNGHEDVDKFSIGIECVGYHNKAMGASQMTAIRDLVKELQAMYRISDDRVVAHSHVAYGASNRWHRCKHRGRKRCGMQFAMPSVRARLGLRTRPAYDPDTRARRLVQADGYLEQVLYGRIDIFRGKLPARTASPSGGLLSWFKRKKTSGVKSAAPKQAIKAKPAAAPKAVLSAKKGPKSIRELRAKGWVCKGKVDKKTPASKLVGRRWNAPDTYYTIRNRVLSGRDIDEKSIEIGMSVWVKK